MVDASVLTTPSLNALMNQHLANTWAIAELAVVIVTVIVVTRTAIHSVIAIARTTIDGIIATAMTDTTGTASATHTAATETGVGAPRHRGVIAQKGGAEATAEVLLEDPGAAPSVVPAYQGTTMPRHRLPMVTTVAVGNDFHGPTREDTRRYTIFYLFKPFKAAVYLARAGLVNSRKLSKFRS